MDLEVILAKERYRIISNPLRLLTLIFNSYEAAIQNNRELTKIKDELRQLSTYDVLTGLYNRTFFDEELIRLGLGRDFPVSIITADVDGLKIINDTWGHKAADQLYRAAAELLEGFFRAGDVVARVGGDEFVVLLPKADERLVEEIMVRLRERLQEENRRDVSCQQLNKRHDQATTTLTRTDHFDAYHRSTITLSQTNLKVMRRRGLQKTRQPKDSCGGTDVYKRTSDQPTPVVNPQSEYGI